MRACFERLVTSEVGRATLSRTGLADGVGSRVALAERLGPLAPIDPDFAAVTP